MMETTTGYDNWTSKDINVPTYVNWSMDRSAPDYRGHQGLSTQSIIQASILGVCTFLILISNAFILLVLHRVVDCFENVQQLVFKALAITDLLTGVLCCAMSMLAIILGVGKPFTSSLCAVRGAACTGLVSLSALLITVACFERFLAIVYPMRYPTFVNIRRAKIAILIVCVLAVSNAGLSVLRGKTASSGNLCLSDFSSESLAFRPSLITTLLILTITLALTTIFNIKVMTVVSGHTRRLAAMAHVIFKPIRTSGGLSAPRDNVHQHSRSLKGLRVLIIATVTFFVAVMPWNIVSASQFVHSTKIATPTVRFVCSVLLLSNSWMNAIIFFLFSRRFRKAAMRVLCRSQQKGNTPELFTNSTSCDASLINLQAVVNQGRG